MASWPWSLLGLVILSTGYIATSWRLVGLGLATTAASVLWSYRGSTQQPTPPSQTIVTAQDADPNLQVIRRLEAEVQHLDWKLRVAKSDHLEDVKQKKREQSLLLQKVLQLEQRAKEL